MKTINFIFITALLFIGTAQLSVVEAAEVRSISRAIVQKINGKPSLKIKVTCAEIDEARVIVQLKRSGKWCSADLPSACSKQKVAAAETVCGTHFQSTVDEYYARQNVAPAETVSQAQPEPVIEPVLETDVELAAVKVPLTVESDNADETQKYSDSDLEKRYQEYVESIEF